MPRDNIAPIEKGPFHSRKGEAPLTRVLDLYDAVEVRVLRCPSSNDLDAISAFISATWADVPLPTKKKDAVSLVFQRGALWQSQEILPFMVLFNNITRIATHQLVRQRVGVTFSQQCSGDSDWRHHDVLLPRCFSNRLCFARSKDAAIDAKILYADLIDRGMSVRDARYVLPQSLATFLYMFASASTLSGIYQKRSCSMISNWEMITIMEKMREAVLEVAPYLHDAMQRPVRGTCWWSKAHPSTRSNMYLPDADHDAYDIRWNPASFEHQETPAQSACADAPPILPRFYESDEVISETEWRKKWNEYHKRTT